MITNDKIVHHDHVNVSGTTGPHDAITVYDGTTVVGTGEAGAHGHWSVITSALPAGTNNLTATASHNGHVSAMSAPLDFVVASSDRSGSSSSSGSTSPVTSSGGADSTHVGENSHHQAGTAAANSFGNGSSQTGTLSHTVNAVTSQQSDAADHAVTTTSGAANHANGGTTSAGASGDSNGHLDTFVFAANFGHESTQNFGASGSGHDMMQVSSSEFSNFASVLAHASQAGQDMAIASGHDAHNSLSSHNSHDFHFS